MRSLAPPSPSHARPFRRPPASTLHCDHFGACSGCTLATSLDAPPLLADARRFFAELGHELPVTLGPVHGWRNRARLAVRGEAGSPVIGLFAAGTHDVLPVPNCAAHHPSVNAAAAAVLRAATAQRTVPWSDARGAGELRYIQVATLGTGEGAPVELSLIWGAPPSAAVPPRLAALAAAVRAEAGPLLASLHVSYHPAATNSVVGPDWARLLAPGEAPPTGAAQWHWETFHGAACAFSPQAFLQSNYGAFDALCAALPAALPPRPGRRVVDLYAGTGALGLSLLSSGAAAALHAVEVTPAAAAPFAAAAARLGGQARMSVVSAGSGDALEALRGSDTLIVDPPRRGLDAPLLRALCDASPDAPAAGLDTLAYVSCGFPALKRDAAALLAAGWALRGAQAFIWAPGADALETLAVFERRG